MAVQEGGFGDKDPLMEHTDDRNAEDDGDTTGPSQPGSASTPGHSKQMGTTTMNRPPEHCSHTAETSFIEGNVWGRQVYTQDSMKIQLANETLTQKYHNYGWDANVLTLKISEKYPGKVVVFGPRGGETPRFKPDNQTINPKLPKTVMKTLSPERTALIQQKNEDVEEIEQNIRDKESSRKWTSSETHF